MILQDLIDAVTLAALARAKDRMDKAASDAAFAIATQSASDYNTAKNTADQAYQAFFGN